MNNRIVQHTLFWLGYLVIESYFEFAWLSGGTTPPMERLWMAILGELTQLPVKILLSYFTIHLVNKLSGSSRRLAFILLAGISAFAVGIILQRILIIKFILPDLYHEKVDAKYMLHWGRIISTFIDIAFVVGIAVAAKQFRLAQRSREREKSLVKEKLEAELKFLRTQTNPHFLFNTLNNIYALARKKSDDTADVVMKLSKLLRFMLYESKKDSISISEELRMLNDYIELEKIRYNERLTIRFTRSIDDDTHPIAPLILLPFVENAFKHGAGETRFNSYIDISAQLRKGQLNFIVENSKEDDGEDSITENIGLSNVRRQLELMYPEHNLDIQIHKDVFKINLNINLDRYAAV
jgi:LytS/YehU family sensor histidine kinase